MELSKSITQEQWEPVYQKSVIMAKKLGLYDYKTELIHGQKVHCIVPSYEVNADKHDPSSTIGWYASGTLSDFRGAESHFTPKNLDFAVAGTEPVDVLAASIPECVSKGKNNNTQVIWDRKTQGQPYHMALLAIACMIEQELGIQATVYGDITYQ